MAPMGFDYFEPATLAEASEILRRYKGKARVLAGGTDLVPRMRRGLVRPRALVNLKRVPGLDGIVHRERRGLTIGPLVTFAELVGSKVIARSYPALTEAFEKVATPTIRNRATLGGNICNAAPSADSAPILMAMDARVSIYGKGRTSTVPLEKFFTGPGSILCKPGELVKAIVVPEPRKGAGLCYVKHKTREALEIAVVGVAAMMRGSAKKGVCEDARLIVGACAPVPLRIPDAEAVLVGKRVDMDVVGEAARTAAERIAPITDVRGTIEYRRDMTEVRTREALVEAWKRATGVDLGEVV